MSVGTCDSADEVATPHSLWRPTFGGSEESVLIPRLMLFPVPSTSSRFPPSPDSGLKPVAEFVMLRFLLNRGPMPLQARFMSMTAPASCVVDVWMGPSS